MSETLERRIRRMREDGHTIRATAKAFGITEYAVSKIRSGYVGKVSNARLRDAFLASRISAADVARTLGWESGHRKPDTGRLRRTLGLLDDISRTGRRARRRMIDWETGSLIADAIGVEPWTVLDDDFEAAA